jgi:hypothetical protein
MSTLTGNDVYGLMEAYQAVYAPQELTEEQVWEEVEEWVNTLIEEGYDLSDYTWEEMFEAYIDEQGRPGSAAPRNQNVFKFPTSSAGTRRGAAAGTRTPTSTPAAPAPAAKPAAPAPAARPAAPAPAARPAAPAPAARPAAPAPAARPAAPAAPKVAPKPAATPSGGSALDRATAAASKPAAFSPKPQSDVGGMIARSQARQAAQTPKPSTPTPTAKPTPRQARLNMEMEYDTFDAILEHLVAEGYADTNESALAIMANMSEEWKETIICEDEKYDRNRRRAAQRAAARNAARDAGKTGAVPGVGYVTPRREGETYRDSSGVERHTSGAKMPKK